MTESNTNSSSSTPPPSSSTPPPVDYQSPATAMAPETNSDAKMWGMLCHLSALAMLLGIPLAHIIGPLVIWLIKKDTMPFVDDQGKESLNFQITMTFAMIISAALICVFVGFFLLGAVVVMDLIFIIIATIKANSGERYRYPFNIRLIK